MFSNKELLSKKTKFMKMVSLPEFTLSPEEADQFIDYIVDQSVMKNNAQIVKMNRPQKSVRTIGFSSDQFLFDASKITSKHYTKEFIWNRKTITSKHMKGVLFLADTDVEDLPEGAAFKDKLMLMVTKLIANQLDHAFWIADTASLSGFASPDIRAMFDGWRYQMRYSQVSTDAYWNKVSTRGILMTAKAETAWTVNTAKSVGDIVDVKSASPSTGFVYICTVAGTTHTATEPTWPTKLGETVTDGAVTPITWRCHAHKPVVAGGVAVRGASAPYDYDYKYQKMLDVFPSVYKTEGLESLRFFNSDQLTQKFLASLISRATPIGDAALTGKVAPQYNIVPIVSCPLMPTQMSAAGALDTTSGLYSDILLTHKENLIIGMQKEISIEAERSALDGGTYWVYNIRGVADVGNVNACVLCEKTVLT